MNKPTPPHTPQQLAALSLRSDLVIRLVREIAAGDNAYMDRLYHYGHGVIPGSVVQAISVTARRHRAMSNAQLSAYMRADTKLVARLERNLSWEFETPELAQRLCDYARLLASDAEDSQEADARPSPVQDLTD